MPEPCPHRPRFQSITSAALLAYLLLTGAASAQEPFALTTQSLGFEDINANGLLDCGEPVTIRVDFQPSRGFNPRRSGTLTFPAPGGEGLLFLPGSVEIDPSTTLGCLGHITRGNDADDAFGEVFFNCPTEPPLGSLWDLSVVYRALYYNSKAATFTSAARVLLDDGTRRDAFELSETPSVSCTTPAPVFRIEKTVQGSGAPGSVLLYTLTITNLSTTGQAGMQFVETVPSHTTYNVAASSPTWLCLGSTPGSFCRSSAGPLAPGASVTRFYAVTIDSTLPAGVESISNIACARGGSLDFDCTAVATPTTGEPLLNTTKTLASGTADPGGTLVYALGVTNLGNQDAGLVTLTETVPPATTFAAGASTTGWTCAPGTGPGSTCTLVLPALPAGASTGAQFALAVDNPLPAGIQSIANTACANDPGGEPDCGSISTPTTGMPSLHLTKTLSGSAAPGGQLTYTLRVQNVGNQGTLGVVASEVVPELTTFVPAASSPGWSCVPSNAAGSHCSLFIGALDAGATVDLTFTVVVASPLPLGATEIANDACASGPVVDDSCDTITTPTLGAPELSFAKVLAGGESIVPGETLVFRLTVTNSGNQDAGAARLTETVPPLARFTSAASTPGWSCAPDGNPGATCTFDLPDLPAGVSRTVDFALVADDPLPPGATILNSACADLPDPGLRACETVETSPALFLSSTLAVEIAEDRDHSGGATAGDTLRYTLRLPNETASTLAGLTTDLTLDPYTRLVPGSVTTDHGIVTLGNAPSDSGVSVAVGSLPAGQIATVTFVVALVQPLPEGLARVSAQALTRSDDIPDDASDDPATPEEDDPTSIAVSATPPEPPVISDIPALDLGGLTLLAAGLAGAATAHFRRGRRAGGGSGNGGPDPAQDPAQAALLAGRLRGASAEDAETEWSWPGRPGTGPSSPESRSVEESEGSEEEDREDATLEESWTGDGPVDPDDEPQGTGDWRELS